MTRSQHQKAIDEHYHQIKVNAGEIWQESKQVFCEAQGELQDSLDDLLQYVRKNPLGSVLMAAGAGFILAKLIKK